MLNTNTNINSNITNTNNINNTNNYPNTNNNTNNSNTSPSIITTVILKDGSKSIKRMMLTNRELTALKTIYEHTMIKRYSDVFIDLKTKKSLMNKGLIEFSAFYKNLALTYVTEAIIKSNAKQGSTEFDIEEDDKRIVVQWRGIGE